MRSRYFIVTLAQTRSSSLLPISYVNIITSGLGERNKKKGKETKIFVYIVGVYICRLDRQRIPDTLCTVKSVYTYVLVCTIYLRSAMCRFSLADLHQGRCMGIIMQCGEQRCVRY